MSNDMEISKKIARILRLVAAKIEENPELLKDVELSLSNVPTIKRKKKAEPPTIDFDVFEIYAKGGEEALHKKLDSLELASLKRVVAKHNFDSSKLAEKWRSKERLVNLILDRVTARSEKGKVFKEYP